MNVPETTPVGTALPMLIRVEDKDQDANSDVTMSVEWNMSDHIALSPVTFRHRGDVTIVLKQPLDFETQRRVQFRIFANETNNPALFTECDVTIDVENENDNAPLFANTEYHVNVSENTEVGELIFRASATDHDSGKFGRIYYSLEDAHGDVTIGRKSGEIRLSRKLDYEERQRIRYAILARDPGPSSRIARTFLFIYVIDEIDNIPVFPRPLTDVYVIENSPRTKLTTLKATDADVNDVLSYSLTNPRYGEYFSVTHNDDNTADLFLERPLDYESVTGGSIELTVDVTDSGFLRSTATLVVNVIDANDNRPRFVRFNNISVEENIGGGILVGSILADDDDSGNNGRVNYYVTSGQEDFGTVFRLNELTGDITTKPGISPDYETIPVYDVTIMAQDNGIPSLSTTRKLRIEIDDVNDNAPLFTKSIYDVTVDENDRLRDFGVEATDVDSGKDGTIRYRISGGNDRGVFRINDVTGDITNVKVLDYERLGDHVMLDVIAQDNGNDVQLSSSAKVVITINDVNDNAPIFSRSTETSFQVQENILGPKIAKFTAYDVDSGDNGRVTYSIVTGNDDNTFTISPLDGELRVTHGVELDREHEAYYNVTICAMDRGEIPKNDTIFTQIHVTDANDNPPQFVQFPNRINLSENTVMGFSVYHLVAEDMDSGKFGEIEFSIENEDRTFSVNSKTGIIYLMKSLDRETRSEYNLQLVARDNPRDLKNSRTTRRTMQILIDDVNDETPRFVGIPYIAEITENSPPGTELRFVSQPIVAIDNDDGRNADVTYSLVNDESGFFAIDSLTGSLRTIVNIDREELIDDIIKLTIQASDIGFMTSQTTVTINVLDLNDNTPSFGRARRVRTRVREDLRCCHVIARMGASDPDKGDNGRLFYSIVSGGYDHFVINRDTGSITVAPGQSLDREVMSQYRLVVMATDRASNPLSSTAVATVTIDDVNDSRPRFLSPFLRIQVHENSPVGSKVTTLVATDDDLNSDLVFSMTSVTIYDVIGRPVVVDTAIDDVIQTDNDIIISWFHLNSSSGDVTLASNDLTTHTTVDREVCSSITITFSVRDEASYTPEVANAIQHMMLQIDIVDQNDNSPVITTETGDIITDDIIISIDEECDVGTMLMGFGGRDVDQGVNGRVSYEVGGPGRGLVGLDGGVGASLVTKSRLDREVLSPPGGPGWVNITLTASDHGFPSPRSTRVIVRVRVDDVNDNYPVFTEDNYDIEIPEDLQPGSIVTSAIAMDIDDSAYGDVTYKLHGAVGFFTIHQILGKIRLVKPLDREVISEHKLTIVATDNVRGSRNNRKKTTKKMTITVSDVNDNSPVFDQPQQYKISVLENTTPGTRVAMVTATDRDEGNNGHVTYSLRAFVDFFSIDPIDGDVTISRQVVASPRLPLVGDVVVFATDGGGRESNMTLQVRIVDVNDHVPKFESPAFNVIRILEEQPGGLFVTQAMATDDDIGLNADVRYRLHDPDLTNQGAFMIDDVTGRVITSRRLDRELRHSYSVVIQAHDLGDPQLQSTRILNVILDDVNDNRPNFPASGSQGASQRLRFPEDAPIGSIVGHVTRAVDRDDSAQIFYHILTQDVSGEPILGMNGDKIVLMREVDREAVESYQLVIGATDNPNFTRPFLLGRWDATVQQQPSALMADDVIANDVTRPIHLMWDPARDASLLRLYVTVDDVIDEPPRFSRDVYVTAVEGNTRPRTKIIQINATDYDVNDDVTYSIQNINFHRPDNSTSYRRNAFVINPRNGVIKSGSHVIKGKGYFLMTVQARDSANHSATCQVKVHILQRSKKIQFVLESPPDVVREQQEKFSETLRRMTGSIVTIDDVSPHLTTKRERDVTRSDVTIRIFDPQANIDKILQQLKGGSPELRQLFQDYSFYEVTSQENDVTGLHIAVFLLLFLLILLIVLFVVFIIRMRRSYREKIEKLKSNQENDVTANPHDDIIWEEPSSSDSNSIAKEKQKSMDKTIRNVPNKAEPIRSVKRSFTTDSPTLASTLLWSPSSARRPTRSVDSDRRTSETPHDVFEYDITLHGGKPLTPLHGSDSGSSF
uniref:cadherin-23-like n=1 Tax=Ciona intestinalis TaxID=7719 RepID=UPI000EF46A45|nr:cadherin-23-like [Ciona intestinalis]|eukprot:XP_026694453.1 cadherin-23-like [Ciona intestinalis]